MKMAISLIALTAMLCNLGIQPAQAQVYPQVYMPHERCVHLDFNRYRCRDRVLLVTFGPRVTPPQYMNFPGGCILQSSIAGNCIGQGNTVFAVRFQQTDIFEQSGGPAGTVVTGSEVETSTGPTQTEVVNRTVTGAPERAAKVIRTRIQHPPGTKGQYRCNADGQPANPGTGWCDHQSH